jgi:geranylgeranyl pyrophosphate synthase
LQDRVHGPRLRDLLGKPLSEHERDTARALVAASPGITAASDLAQEYAARAAESADRLGDSTLVSSLSQLSLRVADDLSRSAAMARERFEELAG